MGNLICMLCYNSKESSQSPTTAHSILYTQAVAPVSTPTYKALSPAQMLNNTSTRTETPLSGVSFRSMDDLQEEGNSQPMTLTPRHLTQAVSQRLLMS
ncbi:AC4 Protein [Mirabilis leaf curl virus]|uniref:AC4 Protein n=1 Tax=Mirabilis leaf curl virus TaxID=1431395 RepID=A0A077V302_9GEMI|nr:AC4 Protein [Mirabilis leaf curl virus]CDR55242.1 AC4 Protein [Mirabilis leaf curl virus]